MIEHTTDTATDVETYIPAMSGRADRTFLDALLAVMLPYGVLASVAIVLAFVVLRRNVALDRERKAAVSWLFVGSSLMLFATVCAIANMHVQSDRHRFADLTSAEALLLDIDLACGRSAAATFRVITTGDPAAADHRPGSFLIEARKLCPEVFVR